MNRQSLLILIVIFLLFWGMCGTEAEEASQSNFIHQEISFYCGKDLLRGTLFRPSKGLEIGAVVILGGSERSARNPYKKLIAENFVRNGLAALIYDSPGTGQSEGNALIQTKADRVMETIAAMRFLRSQKGIHPKKVGVWGLSEGGSIALLAAAKVRETAFCVAVSSALGISPLEISRYRIEVSGLQSGFAPEDIQRALVLEEILYEMFSGANMVEWRLLSMKVRGWMDEPLISLINLTHKISLVQTESEQHRIQAGLKKILKPWLKTGWFKLAVPDPGKFEMLLNLDTHRFFTFLRTGPWAQGDWNYQLRVLSDLDALNCPVLAIWGELDRYLPPHRCSATLKHLFSKNPSLLTIEIIPETSHILTLKGRNDIVPVYFSLLTDWLRKSSVHKTDFQLP